MLAVNVTLLPTIAVPAPFITTVADWGACIVAVVPLHKPLVIVAVIVTPSLKVTANPEANADLVVEITGDCPIIDPNIVEQTIQMFKVHEVDYVSNTLIKSYPDGMDTQVFKLDTLKRSASMTNDRLDHEHVTLHIRNNPMIFSHIHLIAPPDIHWPHLGLTLDELDDYKLETHKIESNKVKQVKVSKISDQ